jgi:hypothetical protein
MVICPSAYLVTRAIGGPPHSATITYFRSIRHTGRVRTSSTRWPLMPPVEFVQGGRGSAESVDYSVQIMPGF